MEKVKIGRNIVVSDKSEAVKRLGANSTFLPPSIIDIEIGNFVKELSFLQIDNGVIKNSLGHYPNL